MLTEDLEAHKKIVKTGLPLFLTVNFAVDGEMLWTVASFATLGLNHLSYFERCELHQIISDRVRFLTKIAFLQHFVHHLLKHNCHLHHSAKTTLIAKLKVPTSVTITEGTPLGKITGKRKERKTPTPFPRSRNTLP